MKFLFTGNYEADYNRTRIIAVGLEKLGHEIVHFPFKKGSREIKSRLVELSETCDYVFLPAFTQWQAPFVRKSLPKKKIIFDPLISHYMTRIFDYKLTSPWNPASLLSYFRDRRSQRAADLVFCDTEQHKKYFHRLVRTPLKKMEVLYIGNDFADFYPAKEPRDNPQVFRVGFYGGFIPLQGVLTILKAAVLLRDRHPHEIIEFDLIGSGFEFEAAQEFVGNHKLENVKFPGWIPYDQLRERLQKFDVALGIFGDGMKADYVIPNKIYHYAGCGLPIITKDTPAIREVFTPDQNIALVSGTPEELAKSILKLRNDAALRAELGRNAFQLINNSYNETKVAETFLKAIATHF